MRTQVSLDAFGTYLFLAVRRPAAVGAVVRLAQQVVGDVDATCSRFRADSDLSRVNRQPGRWVEVDPLLVAAVDVACAAADATGGLVNPLLGRPLVELGYDHDFRVLHRVTTLHPASPAGAEAPGTDAWRGIGRDPVGALRVPEGTALDLGATGKAWAADLIAAAVEAETGETALVSVGGDIGIAAPDGRAWRVAVSERPGGPVEEVVGVVAGGFATSSTRVRRWRHGDVVRHHILDPRTGAPATEVWRTVSASGPSCVAANTASTAAVLLGQAAPAWLEERQVAARLVPVRGAAVTTSEWPRHPAGEPVGA